uniref:Uncharacterized protein n=1 Tax=Arundo donax TaxID=35708 RepID=A0A0A9HI20_ARUDO
MSGSFPKTLSAMPCSFSLLCSDSCILEWSEALLLPFAYELFTSEANAVTPRLCNL